MGKKICFFVFLCTRVSKPLFLLKLADKNNVKFQWQNPWFHCHYAKSYRPETQALVSRQVVVPSSREHCSSQAIGTLLAMKGLFQPDSGADL